MKNLDTNLVKKSTFLNILSITSNKYWGKSFGKIIEAVGMQEDFGVAFRLYERIN